MNEEETQSLLPSDRQEAKPTSNRLKAVAFTAICALAGVAIVAYSSEASLSKPATKQTELKSNDSHLKATSLVDFEVKSSEDKTKTVISFEDINRADFSKKNVQFGRDKIQLKYKEDERLLTIAGITEAIEEEKKKEHPNLAYYHMDAFDRDYQAEEKARYAKLKGSHNNHVVSRQNGKHRKLLDSAAATAVGAAATVTGAAIGGYVAAGVATSTIGAIGATAYAATVAAGAMTGGVSVAITAGVAAAATIAIGSAAVAAVGLCASAAVAYAANGLLTLILHPNVCTYQTYLRDKTWVTPDCLPGYSKFGILGDCMPACKAGYGADPIFYKTCRQVCPAGYADFGLTCHYTASLIGNQQCNDPNYPNLFLGKCYANGVNTGNLLPLAQLNPCPGNCNDILGTCWTKWGGCHAVSLCSYLHL